MLKIEYVSIDSLKPYENNTRLHTDYDIEKIMESVERYGFNDPLGVWHDIIVEGHGRLEAAKRLGMDKVPIIRLDALTDEQRKEYGILHNKTAELSRWDYDKLQQEVAELDLDDFELHSDLDDLDLSELEQREPKEEKEKQKKKIICICCGKEFEYD